MTTSTLRKLTKEKSFEDVFKGLVRNDRSYNANSEAMNEILTNSDNHPVIVHPNRSNAGILTSASSGGTNETITPTNTSIQTEMTKSWLQFDQPMTPETRSKVQDLQERLQVLVSEDNPVADKVILELSRLSNQEQGNQSNLLPMTKDASQKNDNETKQNTKPPSLDSEHIRNDETQLLRECLYALQGLNGKYLYYSEDGEFQINYNTDVCHDIDYLGYSVLGNGAYDALQLCGRAGWFYRRIQNYIETAYEKDAIARALAEALSNHLNQSYHGTLAKWDAQLQKDLSDGTTGISLRQLMRSMRQPTHQLQILAILVDGISALKGGPLLTALTRHMYHGNTRHSMLTEHMLKAASQPWYHDLYLWTMQGTLLTNKFFVQTQDSSGDNWHTSFQLVPDQVPEQLLPSNLVALCFKAGKGINFIRKCLLDSGWRLQVEDESPEARGFCYGNEQRLTETLRQAEQQINHHIVETLMNKHHLIDHLRGLKQFLLLGQGDFFSVLMEGLHSAFEGKEIIGLYDYALMGIVDAAIKSTNAIDMPAYVLGRVKVNLKWNQDDDEYQKFGPGRGKQDEGTRNGWDIFSLAYKIPEPLAAIIHKKALDQYQQLFAMLFRLKRVEFLLHRTWRQSTALHHAIQIYAQYNAIKMSTNTEYAQTTALLRHISMTRQSMMHFVVNLKSYLFFNVLEGAWNGLLSQLEMGSSLDEFLTAHDAYLEEIIHKSLLDEDEEDDDDDDDDSCNENMVVNALGLQMNLLLTLALEFCTFQEHLFLAALKQAERATEKLKEAERRSKLGDWGFVSEKDVKEANTFFGLTDSSKVQHVMDIEMKFNRSTEYLLKSIHNISHGTSDTSMNSTRSLSGNDSVSTLNYRDRFGHDALNSLTFQLDYSGYYNIRDSP